MSSSASASRCSWPCYGEVPMTRCPACPRTAPLKWLVTTTDKNGNLGREFVKCENKQEQGKKLKQCAHFEWLDEYIERIQLEGASRELDLPLEAEKFGSGAPGSGNSIGATVGDAAGTAELKKLNKEMKKLIELKKQGNLMAIIFYVCVIALTFVYVMIISH
uniref:GRF-type domain-containing protein n=1 Tax=Hordeum vulgare subsp. vulgare TaxID=112509 RepID=A0A8I6YWH2_HORVV